MDPYQFRLPPYSSIPLISQTQYAQMVAHKKITLFKNLIIDLEGFDHPGYNNVLAPFLNRNMEEAYTSKTHSLNADLILCHRTIGRLEDAARDDQSRQFYTSIYNNKKVKFHEQTLQKYDPQEPILEWIKKLTSEELAVTTDIPKVFKQPETITFSKDKLKNYLFEEEHYWISFSVFLLEFLLLTFWLLSNHSVIEVVKSVHLIVIGIYSWTLVQYCSHRFQLHPKGALPAGQLRPHLLHHSFPNLKNKVALSWFGTSVQLVLLIAGFRLLFSDFTVVMLFLGFMGTLICYDGIHYFCHFGPETEVGWLKTLRLNHLKHHYRSQQTNFGVTTNIWDKVFGTYDKTSKSL